MSPPPSGILSLRLQGDVDKGLRGLERYHLTHPWAGLGPSAQPPAACLSFFNAFNSVQMVRWLRWSEAVLVAESRPVPAPNSPSSRRFLKGTTLPRLKPYLRR